MAGGGFLPLFEECTDAEMGSRTVLHSDLNNFFASVEIARDPSLAPYPVAVCGSIEERHGIVLAKNQIAKKFGVKTGETIGNALGKCPQLKMVEPHYDDYEEISNRVRKIYMEYTDLVESFGIDECWLDVTGSSYLFGSGTEIADRLRREIFRQENITVSVGVSFCKVFAKLGSDMKKPNAVTVIPHNGFREKIWGLPVGEMLGVGPATEKKLLERSVRTIGQLANTSPRLLDSYFGKVGRMLWAYANGLDASPVHPVGYQSEVKSVGHGATPSADMVKDEEVESMLVSLAIDVGHKLRRYGLRAAGVAVAVRDTALCVREFQARMPRPTQSAIVLAEEAFKLYCRSHDRQRPLRSITVRAIDLAPKDAPRQLDIFEPSEEEDKTIRLCEAMDDIRERFGRHSIVPANSLTRERVKDFGFGAVSPSPANALHQ
ncbi:MAG: DNA polymerase IV [Ruminococcaceae bacterium]|nr:DNA polymerase IV [Oscillospiraceae bacterium]